MIPKNANLQLQVLSMIKEFEFTFKELNIVPDDLLELLGFENGETPEPFPELIEQALHEGAKLCAAKGGYRYFSEVDINTDAATITLEGKTFSPSKIVSTQLKSSSAAVLFACTAGAQISQHAKNISENTDPLLGYVFDVLGSVTVEKAMDTIQKGIYDEAIQNGFGISDRYSPGYCEWNVNEQHMLFSLLPENFCGIELSDSALMHPIKSVSGIIGVGKELTQKGYQCQWCVDENCIYGKLRRRK